MAKKKQQICSFCGKHADEVDKIIVSGDVGICAACIEMSYEILKSAQEELSEDNISNMPKPVDIKNYLDKYIVSQENAKTKTAVAIYNHLKQIQYNEKLDSKKEPLDSTHNFVIGPTGCGKTAIFKAVAKLLEVPFVTVDCSSLSSTGYVGADVTDSLVMALREADGDLQIAERAIIFMDEFDKIARKSGEYISASKDVSGEAVQQGLLKILEGADIEVPVTGKRSVNTETITMNTSNMLFILNGSFEGLDKVIASRVNKKKIGIGEEKKDYTTDDYLNLVTPQDLVSYGILPEIVGRAPSIIVLNSLTEEELIDILTKPKNAVVKQFAELFKMDGIKLTFRKDILKYIANLAMKRKTNARGLRGQLDQLLNPLMYNMPNRDDVKEIIITDSLTNGMKLKA